MKNLLSVLTFWVALAGAPAFGQNAYRFYGRAISGSAPTNGQAFIWNSTTNRYELGTISSGVSGLTTNQFAYASGSSTVASTARLALAVPLNNTVPVTSNSVGCKFYLDNTGSGPTTSRLDYTCLGSSSDVAQFRITDPSGGSFTIEGSGGVFTMAGLTVSQAGSFQANGSGTFGSSSNGTMAFTADGVVTWLNAAGTAFSRHNFGGTTSSFPALRRSNANLQVRLADDSGFTKLTALSLQDSTVAVTSLQTCNAGNIGATQSVNDALTPVWGSTVANGGAAFAKVVCNGSAWTVMGK